MLEESDSFVICDAKVPGYPIRYASKGFQELCGSDSALCEGGLAEAASLLGIDEHVAVLNEVAAGIGLSEAEAFASVKAMEHAAERAVSSSANAALGGTDPSPSVLLLKWNCQRGGLFVCEMSVCKQQHPALGWSYYAGAVRDVTELVPVMKLLQEASRGTVPHAEFCKAFSLQQASSPAGSLFHSLAVSGEKLNSAAEQMWRQELTSRGDSLKIGIKARADGDVRSMASRSTACTLRSCASSSREAAQASAGMHHLGGLVALTVEAKPRCIEEDQRFMDLLEADEEEDREDHGAVKGVNRPEAEESQVAAVQEESSKSTSSEFNSCNSETTCESFSDTGVEALQPLSRSLHEAVRLICRPCLKNLSLPVVIAAPDQNKLAVVLCSQGFERFSGYLSDEAIGQDLQCFLGCPPENLVNWNLFYDAVLSGSFFQPGRPMGSGIIALGDRSCAGLPAGELAFAEVFTSKSGSLIHGLVHLKQVELDDERFVVALLAAPIDSECHKNNDQLTAEFKRINRHVDQVVSILASEFFFQAPFRRQVSCSPAGLAFDEWSELQ